MSGEHPLRALGRRLDAARRQRGWTYREFAERTGMSKSTLQYLVSTRRTAPDYHELVALVGKLGQQWNEEWERLWRRAVELAPSDTDRMPAQLPADMAGFVGRAAELAELDRALESGAAIAALCGMAGVGKTALALRWAHRNRAGYPDGQLYVDLRGYDPDPPVPAADALASFLLALGMDGLALPSALDDRAALFRTLVSSRRMLIVLDNASTVDQVRPLVPGSGKSFAIVTSRDRLAGLVTREGAYRVELSPLPPADATALLLNWIGSRAGSHPAALATLAEQCARLPLALRVAAEFAASRPGTPLPDLVAQLMDEQSRLDMLDTGGDPRTMVRGVLSWSYRHLRAPAARMFRLLGLRRGGAFGVGAAAALAGVSLGEARALLDELCRVYLVQPTGADRFHLHDLLRAYAAELAETVESGPQRRAAIRRLLDYYLHSAYAADHCLQPYRQPISLPRARAVVAPEQFTSPDVALAWFTAEHQTLLAAIGLAVRSNLDGHTWRLAWTLLTYFERRGYWQDFTDTQRVALAATQRLNDRAGQAHVHRCLVRAFTLMGNHAEAEHHLRQALDLSVQVGDLCGQAVAHLHLSIAAERRKRYAEAMHHDRNALELFTIAGNRHGEGLALNQIGCDYLLLGDPAQTLVHCGQALARFEEFGDATSQAAAWDSLGTAHHALGDHPEAVRCYRLAIDLYQRLGSRYYEADSLVNLGHTYDAAGDRAAALAVWKVAAEILDELNHRRTADVLALVKS